MRLCDDHHGAKGLRNFDCISLVFLLRSKTDRLDEPWLESWILMLLRPWRPPLSEARDFFFGKWQGQRGLWGTCMNWSGSSTHTYIHTPQTEPDHLHSLPVTLQTPNTCQPRAFKSYSRAPQVLTLDLNYFIHLKCSTTIGETCTDQMHTGHPGTLTSQ